MSETEDESTNIVDFEEFKKEKEFQNLLYEDVEEGELNLEELLSFSFHSDHVANDSTEDFFRHIFEMEVESGVDGEDNDGEDLLFEFNLEDYE